MGLIPNFFMAPSPRVDGSTAWRRTPARLEKFPELVSRLKAVLEKFADALSCIDQCFIADEMLEHLPLASQVGKRSSVASISTRPGCAKSSRR